MTTGVDRDREPHELAAVLFGCDQPDQITGGDRSGERASETTVEPFPPFHMGEQQAPFFDPGFHQPGRHPADSVHATVDSTGADGLRDKAIT